MPKLQRGKLSTIKNAQSRVVLLNPTAQQPRLYLRIIRFRLLNLLFLRRQWFRRPAVAPVSAPDPFSQLVLLIQVNMRALRSTPATTNATAFVVLLSCFSFGVIEDVSEVFGCKCGSFRGLILLRFC
jgi:hypothetical protein